MIAYVFVDHKSRPHRVAVTAGEIKDAITLRSLRAYITMGRKMAQRGIPVILSSSINWPETRNKDVQLLCHQIRNYQPKRENANG